jgi:hypothetical protein
MKSFRLIMVNYHPKQQYIILFQEHFISGLYLLQGDRYSIFKTGPDFWRALYSKLRLLKILSTLKVLYTCMRFFSLNWFGQKNPSELLNNHLKYFKFWFQIRRYSNFHAFGILSEYGNFPSAYYQNMEIFLSHITRKFSFHILSVYIKFHSAYYLLTLSFSWNGK